MSKEEKKYLGVDWGEKRIGLALGDSLTKTATPFKVVDSLGEIIRIAKQERIDEIVVGAPLKMSDSKYKVSSDFLEFLELLKNKSDIPLTVIDERLSSKAADALFGSKKAKASRDALAAMLILQNYFDKI